PTTSCPETTITGSYTSSSFCSPTSHPSPSPHNSPPAFCGALHPCRPAPCTRPSNPATPCSSTDRSTAQHRYNAAMSSPFAPQTTTISSSYASSACPATS